MNGRVLYAADLLSAEETLKLRLTLMSAQLTATSPIAAASLERLGRSFAGELPLDRALSGEGCEPVACTELANGPLCCDFLVQAIGSVLSHGGPVGALEPWLVDILRTEDQVCFAGGRFIMQGSHPVRSITLAQARQIAEKAEQRAKAIGVPMVIAVLDVAGDMVLHQRMEDALHVSIDVSLNKAYTASLFGIPSHQAATSPLYDTKQSDPRVVIFGGGFPIMDKGKIIGALGISGGTMVEDMDVGQSALQAMD